ALGRNSRDQVIRAAGPKSDDPADWMLRPFRTRRRRSKPKNKETSGENYGLIFHYFLLPSGQSLVPGLPRIYKGSRPKSTAVVSCQFVARIACGANIECEDNHRGLVQ